jgi:hypothetical protein
MCERGVPGGALKLNSTGYPGHGRYGDLSLQGKIPTAEPEIEPGTSWLLVISSDHQATRIVVYAQTLLHINVYASLSIITSTHFCSTSSNQWFTRHPHQFGGPTVHHATEHVLNARCALLQDSSLGLYLVPELSIKCGSFRSQLRNSYDCHVETQQKIKTNRTLERSLVAWYSHIRQLFQPSYRTNTAK